MALFDDVWLLRDPELLRLDSRALELGRPKMGRDSHPAFIDLSSSSESVSAGENRIVFVCWEGAAKGEVLEGKILS